MFSTMKSRRGFTLIELMIVIIVIAILALIVIPKLAGASKKAKESTMKANLAMIRNALEQFQSDTGQYPKTLEDLVVDGGATSTAKGADDTSVAATYKGPYLRQQGGIGNNKGIPKNPFITSDIAEVAGTAARATATDPAGAHWIYNKANGKIWPNATGVIVDGVAGTDDYGLM